MNAIDAAKDYMRGLEIKRQASMLSTKSLEKKFGRSRDTIRMIQNGSFVGNVPEDERKLIEDCINERKRLEGIAKGLTLSAVASRYRVSSRTVYEYYEAWSEL